MNPFSESLRYEYDLTHDSHVIDAGGHQGVFAQEIFKRYGCHVDVFEPIPSFAERIRESTHCSITVWELAIGGHVGIERFHIQNDSTGVFGESDDTIFVKVIPLSLLLYFSSGVDLVKLNIEGMEYEAMEDVLYRNVEYKVKNFQIQFHTNAPNYHNRRQNIREQLSKTHDLINDYPYVWEFWRRIDYVG